MFFWLSSGSLPKRKKKEVLLNPKPLNRMVYTKMYMSGKSQRSQITESAGIAFRMIGKQMVQWL
jgi:hypothetical protein